MWCVLCGAWLCFVLCKQPRYGTQQVRSTRTARITAAWLRWNSDDLLLQMHVDI
jgi:hypothetical protein